MILPFKGLLSEVTQSTSNHPVDPSARTYASCTMKVGEWGRPTPQFRQVNRKKGGAWKSVVLYIRIIDLLIHIWSHHFFLKLLFYVWWSKNSPKSVLINPYLAYRGICRDREYCVPLLVAASVVFIYCKFLNLFIDKKLL